MPTEAGEMKLVGNFRKLIDWVSADPDYNPSNAAITKTTLETKNTAGLAAVKGVAESQAPHKAAINARREVFDRLPTIVRRLRNVAKASGASEATLANMDTPIRKILGERKSAKVKVNPETPPAEAQVQHSASQMSFDNRTGNFKVLLALVPHIQGYNPNEADLKLSALQAFAGELEATNNAVNTSFVQLSQARALKDEVLYEGPDSIVDTAQLVKAYVSGALGRDSHLNQQIKGLQFTRR